MQKQNKTVILSYKQQKYASMFIFKLASDSA